jgi:hypothetical protein
MEQSSSITGESQAGDRVTGVNIGEGERLGSVLLGGALAVFGLTRTLRRGSLGG